MAVATGDSNRAVAQRLVLFGTDHAHRLRRSKLRLLKFARTGAQDRG
jgi:hypothetical protein